MIEGALAGAVVEILLEKTASATWERIRGTADERCARAAAEDALVSVALSLLPNDYAHGQLQYLIDGLNNAMGERPLRAPANEGAVASETPAHALRRRLRDRLQVLYDPIHPGGESQAQALGIDLSLHELVDRFLEALSTALAHNLPSLHSRCAVLLNDLRRMRGLHTVTASPIILTRYLVCRSYETLIELSVGGLHNVPGTNTLLVPTPVLRTWQTLSAEQGPIRRAQAWGGTAPDKSAYLKQYPHATETDHSGGPYPTFETRRPADQADIEAHVLAHDPLSRHLLASGVQPAELAEVLGYYERCGPRDASNSFQELVRLREVWGLLLQVTALEDGVILERMDGVTYDSLPLEHNSRSVRHDGSIPPGLPKAPLRSGESVLIPVGTLVPPIGYDPAATFWSETDRDAQREWGSNVSGVQLQGDVESFHLLGPRSYPTAVEVRYRERMTRISVHSFDPKRVYLVSTAWFIGSCPQLFACTRHRVSYLGSLFGNKANSEQTSVYVLPSSFAGSLVVAELEDEVTHIKEVSQGDEILIRDVTLRLGDALVLTAGLTREPIKFVGSYSPLSDHLVAGGMLDRNGRVARFMSLAARSPGRVALPDSGLVQFSVL